MRLWNNFVSLLGIHYVVYSYELTTEEVLLYRRKEILYSLSDSTFKFSSKFEIERKK